jgi:hypothetical protein
MLCKATEPALGPTQPPSSGYLDFLCQGVERLGRKAGHSPPSGAEVVNEWSCISTILYAHCSQCLIQHNNAYTFTWKRKSLIRIMVPVICETVDSYPHVQEISSWCGTLNFTLSSQHTQNTHTKHTHKTHTHKAHTHKNTHTKHTQKHTHTQNTHKNAHTKHTHTHTKPTHTKHTHTQKHTHKTHTHTQSTHTQNTHTGLLDCVLSSYTANKLLFSEVQLSLYMQWRRTGGAKGQFLLIFNLSTRWNGVVCFTFRPLSSRGKCLQYQSEAG